MATPAPPLPKTGETVLITGASSGIGRDLAGLFAADGSQLVLLARRQERLEALALDLNQRFGVESRVLCADLADPAAPVQIHQTLEAWGLTVDVLVNNAGFGALGPTIDLDPQRQLDMIQVNVTALVHLTRLLLPGMVARGRGGVMNISSIAAFQPGPQMAVYFATKAFVLSFSEALAEEVRGTGVVVCCVAPGAIATEFITQAKMERLTFIKRLHRSPEWLARRAHRGFRAGKTLVVPGAPEKFSTFGNRFTPRFMVRRIVNRLLSSGAAEESQS